MVTEKRIVSRVLERCQDRNSLACQQASRFVVVVAVAAVVGEYLPPERESLVNVGYSCIRQFERVRHVDARWPPHFESMKLRGLLEDLPLPI